MSRTQFVKSNSNDFSVSLNSVDLLNNLPGSVHEDQEKLTKSAQIRILAPFGLAKDSSLTIENHSRLQRLPKLPPIHSENSKNRLFQTTKIQNHIIAQENRIKYSFWLTLLFLLTVIALCSIAIVLILIKLESESKPFLKLMTSTVFIKDSQPTTSKSQFTTEDPTKSMSTTQSTTTQSSTIQSSLTQPPTTQSKKIQLTTTQSTLTSPILSQTSKISFTSVATTTSISYIPITTTYSLNIINASKNITYEITTASKLKNESNMSVTLYSLAQNVSIADLLSQGYQNVYNETYSHASNTNELIEVNKSCTEYTVLCAGGGLGGSDTLTLVSCGNCWSILNSTLRNNPVLNNRAFWYFTSGYSFGFAPNSSITQNTCDRFDATNLFRLCWHLDQNVGGWRLGALQWFLNTDFNYFKYLFLNSTFNSHPSSAINMIQITPSSLLSNSSLTIN